MPFGTATVLTNQGKQTTANRLQTTPTRNAPKYVAMGVGATGAARTAAAADTALSSEVESRVAGTESIVTVTVSNDTYQVVGQITASASRAVDEAGLFDAATVGNMFTSATFAVVNLANGDALEQTWKVTES